jgi:hypothetical protein
VGAEREGILDSSWIIEMDGDVPTYFAPEMGVLMGNATGGWGDRNEAMRFARERDARMFITAFLPHLKLVCKAVKYG